MPKIIINEFFRGGTLTTGDEFIELLLTEDLTAAQLESFFVGDSASAKATKFSAYDFTNMSSIATTFQAGTIIAVGGTTRFAQDTSYNPTGGDWNILLNAGGSFLPSVGGGGGDIAGDDIVWVDTASTGATISADGYAVEIGTGAGAFVAAANVNFGTSTNNTGYALNADLAGAANITNWTTNIPSTSTTPGLANGGANTTYINSLRTIVPPTGPVVTIAATDATAAEAGTDPGTFRITRTDSTAAALTVNYTVATGAGQATNGTDYTPTLTGTAVIGVGQSFVDIAITPIDDADAEGTETVTLTVVDTADYDLGTSVTATVAIADNDSPLPTVTKISTIQGSGTAATAGTFTIEGIVVGVFSQLSPRGFYLQEETLDADGSVLTSEGIFVNSSVAVNVGDKVRITGTVQENGSTPSFNQAVITPGSNPGDLQIVATGQQSLVTATPVDLPTVALGDLERYEGMLVTFPEVLTVTEVFNLGRFGEVSLAANGRLFNPTNFVDPNDNPASGTNATGNSNVPAVTAQQNLNDRSRIILDDGSSASNLSDVPYINTTDADPLNDTLRIGSTVTGLTGVLGFGFSNYRIQPTETPVFDYAARPSAPPAVGNANLKVGSFNVLNYFNGDGQGGGFPTSRGADSAAEFSRQRAKIIAAIDELNADVVGLIEIENDGDGPNSAIADLVNGLNAIPGGDTYAFVSLANTTGSPGTDEIKVAFIYKPSAVTPVGNAVYFNDPAFSTARPPLAQTFSVNATGETFTPIINHFKSKSSAANLPGDTDQGDGQGLSNATRKAQSTALLNFISQIQTASGDSDVMVLGDLNAYNEEDPIDILRAGGLTKLTTSSESYVFDGQTGSLDHALVTSSLLPQVTGAAKWNINADEPITLDYNDDVLTTGEGTAEDRNDTTLYAPTPFRSSDHDPVLVGLSLQAANTPPVAGADSVTTTEDAAVTFNVLTNDTDANGDALTLTSSTTTSNGSLVSNGNGSFTYTPALNFNGSDSFAYTISDGKGGTSTATVNITVTPVNDAPVLTGTAAILPAGTEDQAYVITVANLLAGFTDVDSASLSVANVQVNGVALTTNAAGDYVFTPAANANGNFTVTYNVTDGTADTAASLGFTLAAVNDAPVLTGTAAILPAGTEDQAYVITVANLLAGFTDVDSASLSVANVQVNGVALTTNAAGDYVFTPAANANGNFTVTYNVTDGTADTAASLGFTLAALNDAPVANADSATTTDTQPVTINVLANDTDVDGEVLAIASFTNPASGTLVQNANNTFTYTPTVGFAGTTNFTYTVRDSGNLTATATVGVTVTPASNLIIGTNGDDNLVGTSRVDVIQALAGNDTLNGGLGADILTGGDGNDVYIVDADDVIVENPGEGTDLVRSSISWTLLNNSNVENLTLIGSAAINGTGNELANVITGNAAANILTGGAGDDLYVVGNGDTVIEAAGEGTDLVQSSITWTLATTANVENLTLTGSAAINGTGNELANVITGNAAVNVLNGGDGNDTLNGGGGNDTLNGDDGNDILNGETGADRMVGGLGDDTYIVDNEDDVVVEAAASGVDLVQSSVSWALGSHVENLTLTGSGAIDGTGNSLDNVITGNARSNFISGGAGNDTLIGGNGNDTLTGGNGNDTLIGGTGNDTLTGGSGNDRFVYNAFSDRSDRVTDFNTVQDKLDLTVLFSGLGYLGSTPIADGFLRFTQSGSNTLVQIDQNGAVGGASFSTLVNLTGVNQANLVIGANVLV